MKKDYEVPLIEVIEFEFEDSIAASGGDSAFWNEEMFNL